jgi:hypothetical protein
LSSFFQGKRLFFISIFFVLVISFLFRAWGIRYGLVAGLKFYPDTAPFIHGAVGLACGQADPHRWYWVFSPFWMYILAVTFKGYFFFQKFLGPLINGFNQMFLGGMTAESIYYYLGRWLSALLGTGIVWFTFLSAREIFNHRAAIFASLLIAFNFLHVFWSHEAMNDIPMNFLVLVAFWFCWKIYKSGRWRDYFWAGFFAALAVATKINSLPVLVVFLVAFLGRLADERFKIFFAEMWKLIFALLVVASGYFLICWYFLLDFAWFWQAIQALFWQQKKIRIYAGDARLWQTGVIGWWEYGKIFFKESGIGFGLFYLFSVFELVRNYLKKIWPILVWLTFPLVYFIFVSRGNVIWPKHLMPVFPFLAMAAGATLARLEDFLQKYSVKNANLYVFGLVGILLLPNFVKIVQLDWVMSQKDTRQEAAEWVVANIPPKAKILVFEVPFGISPDRYQLVSYLWSFTFDDLQNQKINYVILNNFRTNRYLENPATYPRQVEFLKCLERQFKEVKIFRKKDFPFVNPEIKILQTAG